MNRFRFFLALWLGKIIYRLVRFFRRGGGTALPGLVTTTIAPHFLNAVIQQLPYGSLTITGTNGKTTTTRMLYGILTAAGFHPISNRQGSNLLRGLVSTTLTESDSRGHFSADIGLWETDEFALLPISQELKPRVMIITNLFRDQLDRYGEIEKIRLIWQQILSKFPGTTTLVLNGDDPAVASLGCGYNGPVIYFGLGDESWHLHGKVHAIDVRTCRLCDGPLTYKANFLGHLGDYTCTRCDFTRPPLSVMAKEVLPVGLNGMDFVIHSSKGRLPLRLNLSGIYNVYNALAATAGAIALGIDLDKIQKSLATFSPAFGRFECLQMKNRTVYVILIKNPIGCNAVLRTILQTTDRQLSILIAINDLIADGRDVSWLWDVDFDILADRVELVTTSGIRASDMTLRLKYAGVKTDGIREVANLETALADAIERVPEGGTLYCLPTYTAMLSLQSILTMWGYKPPYWEE